MSSTTLKPQVDTKAAIARIPNGLPGFVRAWKNEPSVDKVAKFCNITKAECHAIATLLRTNKVPLPPKRTGREGYVTKSMREHLLSILNGQLVADDASVDDDDDDDDMVSEVQAAMDEAKS